MKLVHLESLNLGDGSFPQLHLVTIEISG